MKIDQPVLEELYTNKCQIHTSLYPDQHHFVIYIITDSGHTFAFIGNVFAVKDVNVMIWLGLTMQEEGFCQMYFQYVVHLIKIALLALAQIHGVDLDE